MKQITDNSKQKGQTIIETLAAIFVLVTTLTVGLGLAVYTLSNAQNSLNEVVAVNLARDGIEMVRMMRDSNWLGGEATDASGFALTNCADIGGSCYPRVFTSAVGGSPGYLNGYNLSTPNQAVCDFTSTNCSRSFVIRKDLYAMYLTYPLNMFTIPAVLDGPIMGVYLGTNNNREGIYDNRIPAGCSNPVNCPPPFIRKIKLTRINTSPYTNSNSNWEVIVNVYVAWSGKRCATITAQDPETLSTPCKVVLEEHLTNWKDYRYS